MKAKLANIMKDRPDLNAKKSEFSSYFKKNFYEFIKGNVKSKSTAHISNTPRSVIDKAVKQAGSGSEEKGEAKNPDGPNLTRILDCMPFPTLSPQEALNLTPDQLTDFVRDCLNTISPLIYNKDRTGLNSQLILAIGIGKVNDMNHAMGKGKEKLLADSIAKAVYVAYGQRLLDLYKNKLVTPNSSEQSNFQQRVMMPIQSLAKPNFTKNFNETEVNFLREIMEDFCQDKGLKVSSELSMVNEYLHPDSLEMGQMQATSQILMARESLFKAYSALEDNTEPMEPEGVQDELDILVREIELISPLLASFQTNEKYTQALTPELKKDLENIEHRIQMFNQMIINDFNCDPPIFPLSPEQKLALANHTWLRIINDVKKFSGELNSTLGKEAKAVAEETKSQDMKSESKNPSKPAQELSSTEKFVKILDPHLDKIHQRLFKDNPPDEGMRPGSF